MKVKNVGMKIIGNQSFRLLPGEAMEVTGNELWVTDYLDEGKLKIIEEGKKEEPIPEADTEKTPKEQKNEPDTEDDSQNTEEPEKKTAGRRKNQKAE